MTDEDFTERLRVKARDATLNEIASLKRDLKGSRDSVEAFNRKANEAFVESGVSAFDARMWEAFFGHIDEVPIMPEGLSEYELIEAQAQDEQGEWSCVHPCAYLCEMWTPYVTNITCTLDAFGWLLPDGTPDMERAAREFRLFGVPPTPQPEDDDLDAKE